MGFSIPRGNVAGAIPPLHESSFKSRVSTISPLLRWRNAHHSPTLTVFAPVSNLHFRCLHSPGLSVERTSKQQLLENTKRHLEIKGPESEILSCRSLVVPGSWPALAGVQRLHALDAMLYVKSGGDKTLASLNGFGRQTLGAKEGTFRRVFALLDHALFLATLGPAKITKGLRGTWLHRMLSRG